MNFKQDEEHRDILEMVHDFAVNEVKPLAAEIDRTEEFPMKNVKMMAEMGLMGIPFPEEYGGSGMDTLAYIQTVEELSKYCASTGVILSAHTSLCATPIYQFGTEEQKQKYLPKLCSGEWIGAFALTEPNAGTDASGQKTVAVDAGDHWVLNGSKIFITNAGAADVFFVLAMTDKSLGTKGILQKINNEKVPTLEFIILLILLIFSSLINLLIKPYPKNLEIKKAIIVPIHTPIIDKKAPNGKPKI